MTISYPRIIFYTLLISSLIWINPIIAIVISVIILSIELIYTYKEHDSKKRKSTENKHTKRRTGVGL